LARERPALGGSGLTVEPMGYSGQLWEALGGSGLTVEPMGGSGLTKARAKPFLFFSAIFFSFLPFRKKPLRFTPLKKK